MINVVPQADRLPDVLASDGGWLLRVSALGGIMLCGGGRLMSAAGMRFLVLGGTAWLGRQVASTALALGHYVTCLARGSSGDAPDGAVFVHADRTQPGAYDHVAGDQWDVVIDVSRQPGQVKSAVVALADRTGFFVFVSSGNVYADHSTPGRDEDGALLPALAGDVMESMEVYGQAKVACEHHVLQAFGADRALIARVGLIGGPGDVFDRTGYWPLRFARPATEDGAVLTPDAPNLPTQVIDVRDLASWLVDAESRSIAGIFNATGGDGPAAWAPRHRAHRRRPQRTRRGRRPAMAPGSRRPGVDGRTLPTPVAQRPRLAWLQRQRQQQSATRRAHHPPPGPNPGGHPHLGDDQRTRPRPRSRPIG